MREVPESDARLGESSWARAKRETQEAIKTFRFALFAAAITTVCAIVALALWTRWQQGLVGGGLIGLLLAVQLRFLLFLIRSPYAQRNEARTEVLRRKKLQEKRATLARLAEEGLAIRSRITRSKLETGLWEHDVALAAWRKECETYLRENLGPRYVASFVELGDDVPRRVHDAGHMLTGQDAEEDELRVSWGLAQSRIEALRYFAETLAG